MGVAKYIKDEKDAIKEVIYQSGIRVKPVYTPKDLEEVGYDPQSFLIALTAPPGPVDYFHLFLSR